MLSPIISYRLRLQRKRLRLRAMRKRRELIAVRDRSLSTKSGDIFLFITIRNECTLLPFFLQYYRSLGIDHFFFIDNQSDDNSLEYLVEQPDVSIWRTPHSYRSSRFGIDWINSLLSRFGHRHWCLTVDADEFFIYPFCDTRPMRALTDWLDGTEQRSFPAMLLDTYPKGPVDDLTYFSGQNPIELSSWFDPGNYVISKNKLYNNLWIQGGPRLRKFFNQDPYGAPSLNKIPLVKWDKKYVYVSSTHHLLPRGLNLTYDQQGGERPSGILLHPKFINKFKARAHEELSRREHYNKSAEYKSYAVTSRKPLEFWTDYSEKYINWRQLEILGLMSKGNWA